MVFEFFWLEFSLLDSITTAGVLSAISDIVSQKLSGIQRLQIRRLLLKVRTSAPTSPT